MRWWLIAIGFVVAVAWVRGCTSSQAAYEQAVTAEQAQDPSTAIEQYQYAARWYTPWSKTPGQAAQALIRLGREAEVRGDYPLALKAWRRLRGAILGTRGLTMPLGEHLELANERLADLMADQQLREAGPTLRGRSKEQLVADHLALLRVDPAPHTGWSLLVIVSFIGWIVTTGLAIWRGLEADATIRRPELWKWGGSSLLLFGLWMFALTQA